MTDTMSTVYEQAMTISNCWLVGIVWRCRKFCPCHACQIGMVELIGDTGRLLHQARQPMHVLGATPS